MRGVCAVPLCPALRVKGSWLCAGHDADARNKRTLGGTEKQAPKPVKVKAKKLGGITFAQQCQFAGLPAPIAEYTFHPIRKWRFDQSWPDEKLALEIEGGAFLKDGGRHTRGAGFRNDISKYAEAAILGWRVIRVLPEQIENGQALTWIERALLTPSNK